MSFFDSCNRWVMVWKLRIDCTELKIVPRKFLLHLKFGRVRWSLILIFGKDASLRRGLAYEVLIVENYSLKIVATIVEFPQFLVDWCLVMEDGDNELFIDIFSWAGSILKYLFCLFQINDCKFQLLLLIKIDFEFGNISEFGDSVGKFIWIEESGPLLLMIWTISSCLVDIFSRSYMHYWSYSSLEKTYSSPPPGADIITLY